MNERIESLLIINAIYALVGQGKTRAEAFAQVKADIIRLDKINAGFKADASGMTAKEKNDLVLSAGARGAMLAL